MCVCALRSPGWPGPCDAPQVLALQAWFKNLNMGGYAGSPLCFQCTLGEPARELEKGDAMVEAEVEGYFEGGGLNYKSRNTGSLQALEL